MKQYLTLPKLLPWLIIIALLILLGFCGRRGKTDKEAYRREKVAGDSAYRAQGQQLMDARGLLWQYRETRRVDSLRADSAAKAAKGYASAIASQKAEIRQLYAELGKPWPVDTVEVAGKCCEVANTMTYTLDSLQTADSTKDAQYAGMLDQATAQIDSMAKTIEATDRNFRVVDSLRRIALRQSKLRAKISAGVAGGFAPGFGWGGGALMYTGPGGASYGIEAGPSTGGMYYGGRVLKTISLRKKR